MYGQHKMMGMCCIYLARDVAGIRVRCSCNLLKGYKNTLNNLFLDNEVGLKLTALEQLDAVSFACHLQRMCRLQQLLLQRPICGLECKPAYRSRYQHCDVQFHSSQEDTPVQSN